MHFENGKANNKNVIKNERSFKYIMCCFFKKFAAFFAAAAFAAVGLSDCFPQGTVQSRDMGSCGLFTVSVKPCDKDMPGSAADPKQDKNTGHIFFSSLPVTAADSRSVKRPMLIPCGEAFGIKMITEGVLVVDLQQTMGKCAAKDCGIEKGDVILRAGGEKIGCSEDLDRVINRSGSGGCEITYRRDGKENTVMLYPDLIGGQYRAGMWVRDSSAGIGTMTFYEQSTGCFGGLGHPICDADIKTPLPLSKGKTGEIRLNQPVKSRKGSPGWLTGDFVNSSGTGVIYKNCESGVFGTLYAPPKTQNQPIPLGYSSEIEEGEAEIYTSISNEGAKKYKVRISNISRGEKDEKDFDIEVTDSSLIQSVGGILQGMSGSPVIQNGRLVGAVTHVLVDKPTCGYGIFAERMYNELSDLPKSLGDAA